MLNKIKGLNKTDNRTKLLIYNSSIMLIVKGLSILLSFFILPITIGYVSSSTYGVWLTISSIISWISFFDVGINNGLLNKFAECRAINDNIKARKYVSTTYALLFLIFFPICVILLLINSFLDWNKILNISLNENLNLIIGVLIIYFCSNFIFSTISILLTADMKRAISSLLNFIQQIITFVVIIILVQTTQGSLLNLCLAFSIPSLCIIIIFSIYCYRNKYKIVSPSFKYIDLSLTKDLFNLGFKFFVIQIASIILFQTSNFIMIKYYGAESVTQYNIAYKYFFTLSMLFNIIISPIWPAVTNAIALSDYKWIRNTIKKYMKILFIFIVLGLIMLLLSDFVYNIWMGDKIKSIPFLLSLFIYIYICESLIASFFVVFLNGGGHLKLQFIFCCLVPFVFIFLSFIFIKVLKMDVYCIPIIIVLSNIYGILISPIQCYLVFFKNKKGIWAQ